MRTDLPREAHDVETRNRRLLRILLGIVGALVATCFAIGTRW